MKFLQMTVVLIVLLTFSYGGKVTWDSNGNPVIEESNTPSKGCYNGTLETITAEQNATKKGCK